MARSAIMILVTILLATACFARGGQADSSSTVPDGAGPDAGEDAAGPGTPDVGMDTGDTGTPDVGTDTGDTGTPDVGEDTGGFGDVGEPGDVGGTGEAGTDAGCPELPDAGGECPAEPVDPESAIQGTVYLDCDQSSCTWYDQGMFPKYDSPMAGVEVRLYGSDGEWSTTTCSDGGFQFPLLAPGNYLVDAWVPGADDCTSSNQPQRLPKAVAEGEVTIVTVGDSIAVVGSGPLFPELLAGHLAPLADVQNHNIAVSGTRSTDWVPGTPLFDKKLVPELPGADVLIITLGGNDIMAWVGGSLGNYSDLYTKMLELDEFLAGIHANIEAIVTQARQVNPNVDIVFCLYFNYAQSSYWQNYMGSYKELALAATANAWEKARKNVASLPGIVVADLYGALEGELIDPYLSDSVHLSAKGHQFYAEQIFMVLGGARVGADSLGLTRQYGFHLPAK